MKKIPLIIMLIFVTVSIVPVTLVQGQRTGDWDGTEYGLARRTAPYLYLHPDEIFYPVSPEYAISRSNLNRTGIGLISPNPAAFTLSAHTDPRDGYYLDNRMGTIHDDGIERDFLASKEFYPPTVYARVTTIPNGYAVQYWFFYPHNLGPLNTHEGDWEFIVIFTDSTGDPLRAAYSQHTSGETAQWSLVETGGTHPKVYVALGSHASYFRPYQGKLGLANDMVAGSGREITPEDYQLELLTDQPWLNFAGHWGDYGRPEAGLTGERGPLGPMYIQNGQPWNDPLGWESELPVLHAGTLRANWLVYHLFMIIIVSMVLSLAIRIFSKYRLKKRQGTLGPRYLPFLYGGNNLRSAGMLLGLVAIICAVIGYFLPWYGVSLNIDQGAYATDGAVDVLVFNGVKGLQFNRLEPGSGLIQVMGLPIAFGWILFFGTIVFMVSTIGIRESRKMGGKFIGRGVKYLVPVICIILFVIFLSSFLSLAAHDAPEEVTSLVSVISSRPMGGSTVEELGDYGTAEISWGLRLGAFLLILSAVLSFISAAMVITAGGNFYELHPPTYQEPPPHMSPPAHPEPPTWNREGDQFAPDQGRNGWSDPPGSHPMDRHRIPTCLYCGFTPPPPTEPTRSLACPRCGNTIYFEDDSTTEEDAMIR